MKVDDFSGKNGFVVMLFADPYHIFHLVLSQHLVPLVKLNRETIS